MRVLAAAILIAATFSLPGALRPPVVQAAATCTGWSSTTVPPPTVRVLRSSGVVQMVDFKTYSKVVMAAEWSWSWPIESLRAGAVAVKQYAWYYTMHYRGGTGSGGCYDVVDNNNDQIYTPENYVPTASHIQAVDSTWSESLVKNGVFAFTGYRPGTDVACGSDATGYRLFQASARRCALDGRTGEEILQIYYGPGLVIQGAGTIPAAPTNARAVGYDTSAQVSWSAPASDGGSAITGYTVTSAPGGKTCTATVELSCGVGGLTNGTPYTFTVTATNLLGTGPASGPSNSVTPAVVAGSTYHPLTPPVRLLDTRSGNGLGGKLLANTPATFGVAGRAGSGIPTNASAVTGNVTVVSPSNSWAVYLGPNPVANPGTSTINFGAGQTTGNGLTVALGSGGTLSATYISTPGNTTDLVFDVTGFFTPDTGGATYHAISPARLLDTRSGNGLGGKLLANTPATFNVAGRAGSGIPPGVIAVTGNVTVVTPTNSWAVYLGPVPDAAPGTSTINFNGGEVKGNSLTVALGAGGTLSATYISTGGNTTDLVFDVTGFYTADASGASFVPITPARLLDTRSGNGLGGKLLANTPATFGVGGRGVIPANAAAVTGNVTVVTPTNSWAVFLGPDPTPSPGTSTVNFNAGEVKGNGLTVALGGGGTLSATYMSTPGNTTDLVFDVTGYYKAAGPGA